MKKFNIYLIHHSHTDIGYTERQEKLQQYHTDYILQVIDMLDDIHSGKMAECQGFKWQCENQWQVENFLKKATAEQKDSFVKYVKSGEIGLSGNYLNMTELVDYDVLYSRIHKAKTFAENIGYPINSGMSADINGYAWGYADALAENGVNNLLCALHPHHGMFPLYKKQQPFYWEGPNGNKVLTWVSEHYHFGNELGFVPHAGCSYMLFDDYRNDMLSGRVFSTSAEKTKEEELEICQKRLTRYLDNLEKENYPFDFVPFMVSGAITDNAPPNAHIAERISELNKIFGDKINIQMATLEEFFNIVRNSGVEIPTYTGDFPDWWADGIGSTANSVKMFKDAQRMYDISKKLDPDNQYGDKELLESASENMMMYAEHTWGYSTSITKPCDSMVSNLERKKDAYAINANTDMAKNLDLVLEHYGEVSVSAERSNRCKVINPHPYTYTGTAKVYIEYWKYMDNGIRFDEHSTLIAYNEKTGEHYKCQGTPISRAYEIEVFLTLKPFEEATICITQDNTNNSTVRNHAHIGAEGVKDVINDIDPLETPFYIDTPFYSVSFDNERGIASIINKKDNRELLDMTREGAFTGVYEYTPIKDNDPCHTRGQMGRNRCSLATKRDFSKLIDSEIISSGDVYVTAKLSYQLEGTNFYNVFLKIYKTSPLIEATVQLHKKSELAPENVYISLPFLTDGDNETYIDKTGCIIRPGIDQLKGSCQNFYLLQSGIVKKGKTKDLIIAIKDAPLISFGDRKAAPIELCDGNNTKLNRSTPYSWIMNNFWETNFKADLGGFYEFTYTIKECDIQDTQKEFNECTGLNEGLVSFYIK